MRQLDDTSPVLESPQPSRAMVADAAAASSRAGPVGSSRLLSSWPGCSRHADLISRAANASSVPLLALTNARVAQRVPRASGGGLRRSAGPITAKHSEGHHESSKAAGAMNRTTLALFFDRQLLAEAISMARPLKVRRPSLVWLGLSSQLTGCPPMTARSLQPKSAGVRPTVWPTAPSQD
jgi:hypothetical protein